MKVKFVPIILCGLFAVACNQTPSKPSPKYVDIDVLANPEKLTYTEGEYFDPTGLVITAYKSDESTEIVDYATYADEFTFTPSLTTALTTNDTTVTIGYKNQRTTLDITVLEEEVETFTMEIDFSQAPKTNSGNDSGFVQKICSIFENDDNEVTAFNNAGYVQVNENQQTTSAGSYKETVLMLGNQSGFGQLNFTFSCKLISVELAVRAHMKLYVQQGNQMISSDADSELTVNGASWELPTPTVDNHDLQTRTFNINSHEFSLSTKDEEKSRVWIFSATLLFAK